MCNKCFAGLWCTEEAAAYDKFIAGFVPKAKRPPPARYARATVDAGAPPPPPPPPASDPPQQLQQQAVAGPAAPAPAAEAVAPPSDPLEAA